MADELTHTGRIVEITPRFTTVEIVSQTACGSCHAAGFCGMGEAVKKAIQVPTTLGGWHEGLEVLVVLRGSMGFMAVWLAYVIPLCLLLAVLLGLSAAGVRELYAGLAGVAAAAVYYIILWLFRERLRNEYSFYIKEND